MKLNWSKIKLFIRLFWLRALIIGIAIAVIVSIIVMFTIGMNYFMSSEPFYKRSLLASVPMQIFLYLIVGSITAVIHTLVWVYFVFGGGMQKMGAKRVKAQEVNIKWDDVVGMESIKGEVKEVISLLKDRSQVKKVGGKIIKGLLMVGPPGCGKTYMAKAIATETGLPFLPAVGSEFIGMFVGVGAMKIKQLFKEARVFSKTHGGCLIFIDEIDTIARPRVGVSGHGGGMSYNATVNQLLTELDGMNEKENIVIIAATNVNEQDLDPALMRAGRFDRKIYVNVPGLVDREKLFDFYLSKVKYDESIDSKVLARRTVGFSPASISNIVREASLIAVREKRDAIAYKDLSEAYDRIMFGLKENKIIEEHEKEWTAYHEAGHAIIAYLFHPTDDVIKATIIPRKGFLGYVGYRPPYERYTEDTDYFYANIKIALGGYVAEKIKFGKTSSGVSQDMKQALWMAHKMVWNLGMGPSGFIGNFGGMAEMTGPASSAILMSEKTREKLDADVQTILKGCLDEVTKVLNEEIELLEHFAKELLDKQELDYDEIEEIFKQFGKSRPGA